MASLGVAAQLPPRAYFTAAGRPTAAPDSAAYYTRTQRRGAGGTITTYRPDGRRLHQQQYAHLPARQLHGPSTAWTAGRRTSTYRYQRGQLHGLAQAWYPGGQRRWQLPYAQGQRHGTLRAWYASGQLMRQETYRRGVRTGARCFTRAGHDTAYFAFSRPASFAGGDTAAAGWIQRKVRYTALALRNQVEGRVLVRFWVDGTGRVQQPQRLKSVGAGLEEAVEHALLTMPRWAPAVVEGQPVAVPYELAVFFVIR
ncbi:energy transducer TonB [Hymenobacter edaphi]|uniref:TonB C-terminal domain-containing protein n=1 Tax=Hymenobacter edaphi TaxID=2211146 RepID=A0A328BG82_9BACT|nr:energy transducer TonB [Hymenobacter edaphi]RAK66153.1 hypothetical protein DLM85_15785 [Hymenobacter edaphi]